MSVLLVSNRSSCSTSNLAPHPPPPLPLPVQDSLHRHIEPVQLRLRFFLRDDLDDAGVLAEFFRELERTLGGVVLVGDHEIDAAGVERTEDAGAHCLVLFVPDAGFVRQVDPSLAEHEVARHRLDLAAHAHRGGLFPKLVGCLVELLAHPDQAVPAFGDATACWALPAEARAVALATALGAREHVEWLLLSQEQAWRDPGPAAGLLDALATTRADFHREGQESTRTAQSLTHEVDADAVLAGLPVAAAAAGFDGNVDLGHRFFSVRSRITSDSDTLSSWRTNMDTSNVLIACSPRPGIQLESHRRSSKNGGRDRSVVDFRAQAQLAPKVATGRSSGSPGVPDRLAACAASRGR